MALEGCFLLRNQLCRKKNILYWGKKTWPHISFPKIDQLLWFSLSFQPFIINPCFCIYYVSVSSIYEYDFYLVLHLFSSLFHSDSFSFLQKHMDWCSAYSWIWSSCEMLCSSPSFDLAGPKFCFIGIHIAPRWGAAAFYCLSSYFHLNLPWWYIVEAWCRNSLATLLNIS